MPVKEVNFCQRCGHRVVIKTIDNKPRPYCPSCNFVVFLDPKLAAVVLATKDDKLVLVRRAIQPSIGKWSFPSGFVDLGEAVQDAAVREMREETGLKINITDLVGLYSKTGNEIVLAVYSAEVVGGRLRAGTEVIETAFFNQENLPQLPFDHDDQILKDWRNTGKLKN